MSFLNPVSEPVLRFSSTDSDAPQISYNARVAGDVKTVLKACLVVGYGDKASAGWSIVNEVGHVAEFVSPSAAMSDYRLGIDDTPNNLTTWYYQYQDARKNPSNNLLKKSIVGINNTSTNNGWQLLVTERGIYFIEIMHSNAISAQMARLTYWGAVKSALIDSSGINIGFFCVGCGAPASNVLVFMQNSGGQYRHYSISGKSSIIYSSANISLFTSNYTKIFGATGIDLISALYLISSSELVGEQPALLLRDVNNIDDLYNVYDTTLDGRQFVSVCLGLENTTASTISSFAKSVLIPLDYWEY